MHDSRVLRSSSLYRRYLNGTILNGDNVYFNNRAIPQYILGDSGYPNLRKLITPYKKTDMQDVSQVRRQ